MKRRTLLSSALAIPGARALLAQEPVRLPPAAKAAPSETPDTPTVNADSFAAGIPHTLDPQQLSALKRLGEFIAPAFPDTPGASDAHAAEFLDFLIGDSQTALLELYRTGLNALNEQARGLHHKPFSEFTASEAAPILAPLQEPWSYNPPAAVLPRFLRVAKDDLLRATFTSREYISVVSQRRRNAGGTGQYWYPVD